MGVTATLGAVLDFLDGGCATEAWLLVHEAATEATRHLAAAREMPWIDADDLVQEAVSRAFSGGAAAIRRAVPATPVVAWIAGTIRNSVSESFRGWRETRPGRTAHLLPLAEAPEAGADESSPGSRPGWAEIPLDQLSDRQRKAVGRRLEGWPISRIARDMRINWKSVRQLLDRAAARLRAPTRDAPRSHTWALSLPKEGRTHLRPQQRELLTRLADGSSIAELAREHKVGRECMRGRIRRLRAACTRKSR